ncbi:MAG: hypothetical protein WCI18_03325 [Pseudomonadota bacterium]
MPKIIHNFQIVRLLLFFWLILVGCKQGSYSKTNFAVESRRPSLLNLLNRNGSSAVPISICYVARDSANEQVNQRNYLQLKGHFETGFRQWMEPLQVGMTDNGRTVPRPSPYFLMQELKSKCSGSENLKVYFFLNNRDFQKTCESILGPHRMMKGGCRSYALPEPGEIWLNLSTEENQAQIGALVLHELGHHFGLLDTYREKGVADSEREFQPQLTAMSTDNQPALAKDDQEGIRSVWKALVLGLKHPECGAGYKLYQVDSAQGIYCVFERTDTSASNQRKRAVDPSGGPPLFNCTEHLAMMGSWDGCLRYLKARAKALGKSVNEELDANDVLAAVDACVSANPTQTTTCTKKMLSCLTWQWAADNYSCFAGRGGFACFSECKDP